MQARQIMTSPVLTVRPDTPVRDAATLLLSHRITAAPVLDDNDELVGIVSEGDLVEHRFGHDPRSRLRPVDDEPPGPRTVGEVMTTTVIALGPSADAADLATALVGSGIHSVPVVEGATVVGIVSRRDLLGTLVREDADIRADVLARLAGSGAGGWDVEVTDGRVELSAPDGGRPDHDGPDGGGPDHDGPEHDGRAALAVARTVPGVLAAHVTGGR